VLEKDIKETLVGWTPQLGPDALIFVQAPGANGTAIFGGSNPPLQRTDPRVRGIPFPARCASLAHRGLDLQESPQCLGHASRCIPDATLPIRRRLCAKHRLANKARIRRVASSLLCQRTTSLTVNVYMPVSSNAPLVILSRRPTFSETKRIARTLLSVYQPSPATLQQLAAARQPQIKASGAPAAASSKAPAGATPATGVQAAPPPAEPQIEASKLHRAATAGDADKVRRHPM